MGSHDEHLGYYNLATIDPFLAFIKLRLKIKNSPDLEVSTLIDTGSSISVCSPDMASKFKIQPCNSFKIIGVTGANEINQFIQISIQLSNKIMSHKIFVAPNLTRSLILGNDLLNSQKCLINFALKQVKIGDEKFRLYLSDEELAKDSTTVHEFNHIDLSEKEDSLIEIPVTLADTFVLHSPGYTSLPVKVDLQHIFQPSMNYVFEWDVNFLAKHCVYGPGFVVVGTSNNNSYFHGTTSHS